MDRVLASEAGGSGSSPDGRVRLSDKFYGKRSPLARLALVLRLQEAKIASKQVS